MYMIIYISNNIHVQNNIHTYNRVVIGIWYVDLSTSLLYDVSDTCQSVKESSPQVCLEIDTATYSTWQKSSTF